MAGFSDFIKDIFMIRQEKSYVGLSGIKPVQKVKKQIVKSVKKSEVRLSDLMRREHKSTTVREGTVNI